MKFHIMGLGANKSTRKPIHFLGKCRQALREFPNEARRQGGFDLSQLQQGRMPEDWKLIPGIGLGTIEIRLHQPHEHRILCVVKFPEAVYVLHVFDKKTQKISQRDFNIARKNYAKIAIVRKEKSKTAL